MAWLFACSRLVRRIMLRKLPSCWRRYRNFVRRSPEIHTGRGTYWYSFFDQSHYLSGLGASSEIHSSQVSVTGPTSCSCPHTCRAIISTKMLSGVEKFLEKLNEHEKDLKQYEFGQGYYDDLCLARFLDGVCCRYIVYPVNFIIFDEIYKHVF
jgi:hypothetical protein